MTMTTPRLAVRKYSSKAVIRLFCFPYAGSGESIFREWPANLPDSIEVCPVLLPGRGARMAERPFTDFAALIDEVKGKFIPYLDRPFAIYGHSMGALIGFELARHLRNDHNLQPVHMFMSGRCSPQTQVERDAGKRTDIEFIDLLSNYNGTPEDVLRDPELMELMLPIIRADFTLCRSYRYRKSQPFDCPITVFGGLLDSSVSRESLDAWREHTTGSFLVRMLPGDHFFINTDRHLVLGAIAKELHQYLKALA